MDDRRFISILSLVSCYWNMEGKWVGLKNGEFNEYELHQALFS